MPQRLYKILLVLGIFFTLIAIPTFWLTFRPDHNLEVDFLDVGQGDSILIKTPYGQNILIDGGPSDKVVNELGRKMSWWDKQIDLMILTHPHDDHVSGLIEVIKRYKVKKIVYTGVVHSSPNYLTWLELVRSEKIPVVIIDRPQKIEFGLDCWLDIVYPKESLLGKSIDNLNNSSIIARLTFRHSNFLFAGDAEEDVEDELFLDGIDLSADVFKASHHGSDTSNSQEFLDSINPDIVVVQVGEDNKFGHPSLRVVKRLERLGAQIFRTDLDGAVELISNGESIFLE